MAHCKCSIYEESTCRGTNIPVPANLIFNHGKFDPDDRKKLRLTFASDLGTECLIVYFS